MKFTEAEAEFAKRRGGSDTKKLQNNTYLHRIDDDTYGVMLHSTFVVKIHRNGTYTLDSGGWQTPTTKERINGYSPVRMYQERGIWYIDRNEVFEDGCVVNEDGKRVDAGTKDAAVVEKIKKKLDRKVTKYINGFADHMVELGELPVPSQGDCWGCFFKAADEDSEAQDFNGWRMQRHDVAKSEVMGFDHLLSHMDEKYYVPSLLWKAICGEGFGNPGLTWHMIDRDLKSDRTDMLKRVLRGYFRRRKPHLMNLLTAN